jgi:hypothetical protein
MNGTMMIGADQHEVRQGIFASTTEPAYMMRLAQLGLITPARRPPAELALAGVEFAKLFDQIAVTSDNFRHQIAATLFRDTSRLVKQKPSDSVFVSGEQQRL